jgi:hypothetical protein
MNIFTLKSSVKNLVAPYEYVIIKYRKGGGFAKMETYLGIKLLAAIMHLGIKHP